MADEPADLPVPGTTATTEKVADVQIAAGDERAVVTQSFPLRQPEEDWNDFQVGVRASVLRTSRAKLEQIARDRFPWGELLLGLATLTVGSSLSAVISGVTLNSGLGVLFFVIAPPISAASLVAYVMLRIAITRSARDLAEDALTVLPDPDRTV